MLICACRYGLRLILPLTDQWDYYHGSHLTFLRFRNLSTADDTAFYTNSDVVADFKQYIGTLVNRTNTYTNASSLCPSGSSTQADWRSADLIRERPNHLGLGDGERAQVRSCGMDGRHHELHQGACSSAAHDGRKLRPASRCARPTIR